ncbi:unnamed protein product [marine sediment metagenome]|uniref:Uncharacterized protein n=1 Tax=marine sediment metagenome TaxID=412755 RepID=X1BDB2_9ZZZZ
MSGFRSYQIGGNVYEMYPDPVRFITGTGFLVDSAYEIPEAFRLNKVELCHLDANNAPTGVAWIGDLHMADVGSQGVWRPVFERAVTATNIVSVRGSTQHPIVIQTSLGPVPSAPKLNRS